MSPVLSVIERKFQKELECDVERSLSKIQQAVTNQPGFVGLQSSLSYGVDSCELVKRLKMRIARKARSN